MAAAQPCRRARLLLVLAAALLAVVWPGGGGGGPVRVVLASTRVFNAMAGRQPGRLNVHLVPHSHQDPGWLQTYEEYLKGFPVQASKSDPPRVVVADGVSAILDSVVSALLLHPERTFVVVDLAFFVRWWQEQLPGVRAGVKRLVARGQLEFVNGGLVQHDEATSHYAAIVDQMDAGMRFLREEFDVEPKVAWMIDGFGHSRGEPLLRAMGGFDALFFSRAAKEDMEARTARRQMELLWRGSDAYGAESDLFVSQSPSGTYTTPGEHWELVDAVTGALLPNAQLLLDDGSPEAWNADARAPQLQAFVAEFEATARAWARAVPATGASDVMMYIGGDFAFRDAGTWYRFIDKLVHYVNTRSASSGVAAMYSTPERFLTAKRDAAAAAAATQQQEARHASTAAASAQPAAAAQSGDNGPDSSSSSSTWALKQDDFFPYQCELDLFWTGFFSSRPVLKGLIRQASAVLQATRQLEVIAGLPPATFGLTPYKGAAAWGNPSAAAAADGGSMSAADDHHDHHPAAAGPQLGPPVMPAAAAYETDHVPAGPDASVLQFAVALAHHHDAITGTQKLRVRADYLHWLHVGLHEAVPKMLLCLQRLVFGGSGSGSSGRQAESEEFAVQQQQQQDDEDDDDEDDLLPGGRAPGRALLSGAAAAQQMHDGGGHAGWHEALATAAADLAQLQGATQQQQQHDGPHALPTDVIKTPPSAAGLPQLSYCLLLNASLCSASVNLTAEAAAPGFLLVVYNPLSWPIRQGLQVPVAGGRRYTVSGPGGARVPSQLLPAPAHAEALWRAHNFTNIAAWHAGAQQLVFQADVPALGHAVFRVVAAAAAADDDPAGGSQSSSFEELAQPDGDTKQQEVVLSTGTLEVRVSAGGVSSVVVRSTGQRQSYSQQLVLHESTGLFRTPGAYVFGSEQQSQVSLPAPSVTVLRGAVVTEVRQAWARHDGTPLGAVTTRLFNGSNALEVEWSVGPPPGGLAPERSSSSDSKVVNWELFLRHATDLRSGGVWHTDANGLEWQQRRLGRQPSYTAGKAQLLPSNIYPMAAGAVLQDAAGGSTATQRQQQQRRRRMFVSTDRAQGVTSLQDGQLDVLLHRVSEVDDGKGLGERLMDETVANGRHLVWFDASSSSGGRRSMQEEQLHARHHQHMLASPLQLAFAALPAPGAAVQELSSFLAPPAQPLPPLDPAAAAAPEENGRPAWPSLPRNVHVLSLAWRSCGSVLMRLSHIFQAGETSSSSSSSDPAHSSLDGEVVLDGLPGISAGDRDQQRLHNGRGIARVQEATLFGGRPLQPADLQPGRAWPHSGQRITAWEPALWPPPLSPPRSAASAAGGQGRGAYSFLSNRVVGPLPQPQQASSSDGQQQQHGISLRPMQIRSFLLTLDGSHPDDGSGSASAGHDSGEHESQEEAVPVVAAALVAASSTATPAVVLASGQPAAEHSGERSNVLRERSGGALESAEATGSAALVGVLALVVWRMPACVLGAGVGILLIVLRRARRAGSSSSSRGPKLPKHAPAGTQLPRRRPGSHSTHSSSHGGRWV